MTTPRPTINDDSTLVSSRPSVLGVFHKKCFSWTAVFVGALVGIGASFLLNLFGTAIGVTAFAQTTTSAETLAIGGLIALVIIAVFSMGLAGWVAGHLGGMRASCNHDTCIRTNANCNHGVLYGFTAWCVALVLTVMLSGHITRFISHSMAVLVHPTMAMDMHNQDYMNNNVNNVNNANNANLPATDATATATTAPAAASVQDAANALAMTASVTFALFFIGALSACIAGHCGYRSCKDHCIEEKNRV